MALESGFIHLTPSKVTSPYAFDLTINNLHTKSFTLEPDAVFQSHQEKIIRDAFLPAFIPLRAPCEDDDEEACHTEVACSESTTGSLPIVYGDVSNFVMNQALINDPKVIEMTDDVPDLDLDLLAELYLSVSPIDDNYLYDESIDTVISSETGYDAILKLIAIARDGHYAVGVPGSTDYTSDSDTDVDTNDHNSQGSGSDNGSGSESDEAPQAPVTTQPTPETLTNISRRIDEIDSALDEVLRELESITPPTNPAPQPAPPQHFNNLFVPEINHDADDDGEELNGAADPEDDNGEDLYVPRPHPLRQVGFSSVTTPQTHRRARPSTFTIDPTFQQNLQKSLNRLLAKLISMEDPQKMAPILGMLSVRAVHCAPSITGYISDILTNLTGTYAADLHQRIASDLAELRKNIVVQTIPDVEANDNAHGYKKSFSVGAAYGLPELEVSTYADVFQDHANGDVKDNQVQTHLDANYTARASVAFLCNQYMALPSYHMLLKEWGQTKGIDVNTFVSSETGRISPALITYVLHSFKYIIIKDEQRKTTSTSAACSSTD